MRPTGFISSEMLAGMFNEAIMGLVLMVLAGERAWSLDRSDSALRILE